MKFSKTVGVVLVVTAGLALAAWCLVSKFTTFLMPADVPKGILLRRHIEQGIASGEVRRLSDGSSIHFMPSSFVAMGKTAINHPKGIMPYHAAVKGTRFRFTVDSPSIGESTIYLIDTKEQVMFSIPNNRFDLRGVGNGLGSTTAAEKDSAEMGRHSNQILVTHEDIYEKVDITIDIGNRSIEEVRIVHKQ